MGSKNSNLKILKRVGISALLLSFLFSIWYDLTYSMDLAKAYEINSPKLEAKLLIATQGSEYKDGVVAEIVNHFRDEDLFIKVVDVYDLDRVRVSEWDAICLIHTWEIWMAPYPVREFFRLPIDKSKLAVHVTSGDGAYKMKNVDAITGASVLDQTQQKAKLLIEKIEQILSAHHSKNNSITIN